VLSMTSFRQMEANRRNALRNTQPYQCGRQTALPCNATEDAEDYEAFEAAIIAGYART
jgi:hypothetical protein